jgi:hypothetical protein
MFPRKEIGMSMRRRRSSDNNRLSYNGAKVMRLTGVPTKVAAPPPLAEGQVRCECGRGVRLNKDGLFRGHKTWISNVSCIYSYTEPKEEA